MAKKLKPTKKMLDDAAVLAGFLNVMKNGVKEWMKTLQEQHTDHTYEEIYQAYRGANPNCSAFVQSRCEYVEEGLGKKTAVFRSQLLYLAMERHVDAARVRDRITEHLLTCEISAVNEKGSITTINPNILKIYDFEHEDGNESSKHTHTATDTSDTGTDRDSLLAEQIKILQESLADDESE